MRHFPGAVLAASVLLVATAARAQVIVANTWDSGTLFTLDTSTGAASDPRPTGITHLNGIAYHPASGLLYGLSNADGTPDANALFTINPVTGARTLVGSTGLFNVEGDLGFDPTTGTLYGVQHFAGSALQLFTINRTTGAGTVIGTIPGAGINEDYSGLAFDAAGNLFVFDTGLNRLLRVNKANGNIQSSVGIPALGTVAGMTVDAASNAFYVAAGTNLFTLNPATGGLTLVGPTGIAGDVIGGLAVLPVPEPASVFLCGLAAAGFSVSRLARRNRPSLSPAGVDRAG